MWFDRARQFAQHAAVVQLALFFHDAIYDTQRDDNEKQSANLAVRVLQTVGANVELRDTVHQLIMATKHSDQQLAIDDAKLTVDIDLAILGAPPIRFEEYEAQIRQEYQWVPDDVFRQKRSDILRSFLARQHIYAFQYFQEHLEAQARSNLQNSLSKLRA